MSRERTVEALRIDRKPTVDYIRNQNGSTKQETDTYKLLANHLERMVFGPRDTVGIYGDNKFIPLIADAQPSCWICGCLSLAHHGPEIGCEGSGGGLRV